MGPVLDAVTEHLKRYVEISSEKEVGNVDKAAKILKDAKVDVLVINLPINYGGNTDFWNLTDWQWGKTKHASKKRGVDAVMKYPAPFSVNVSHLEVLNDDKICRIEIWGENFGGTPVKLEAKLHVVDSPNSAGVMVDGIRCCKLAFDRGIGGVLESASSYLMKSGPVQYSSDEEARKAMDEFIQGKRVV